MRHEFVPRFVRGVAGVGLGTLIQILLGLLAFLIGARWLPKDQFGAFVLLQVMVLFLLAIGDVLLQKLSVTRFLAAEPDGAEDIIITALSYKLVFGVGIGCMILGLRPLADYLFQSPWLSRLFLYLPLFFLLNSIDELLFATLQGMHRYKEIAFSQIVTGLTRLCFIAIFLVSLRMDVMGLLYAFLVSLAVSVTVQWRWVGIKPRFSLNHALYLRLFKFGFPLGLNSILTFFFGKLDRFLLGTMVGLTGVASYEVAAKIPDNLQRLYQAFQSVFFPNMSELFSQGRLQAAEAVLNNSLRLISFVSISAALFVLLFQDGLTRLVFSRQYSGSAPAFSLLMISLNMALSGNLMGTALVAAGRSDRPVRINIVMALIVLCGNLLFIPALGFVGAAWAALMANYCTNLTASIWYLRKEGIVVSWKDLLKPILLFAAYAAFILAIKPESIAFKAGLACLFVLSGIPLSIVSKRDLSVVLTAFRSPSLLAVPIK
jgi:O-antigen/teichoic acid export membrane protein